jgi:hypothetical protein
MREAGSQSAGVICVANASGYLEVITKLKPQRESVKVAVKDMSHACDKNYALDVGGSIFYRRAWLVHGSAEFTCTQAVRVEPERC